jgi:hypothetical protein
MMMSFRHCFITYQSTPKSYVILADSQKSPCLGRGDVCITLGGFKVILKDVLHIPSLCCPLFSVRRHRRLLGCSFLADNSGCFLMFPSFTIEVNDSSDCIVSGGTADPSELVDFNAHVAGCVSAVNDNTHHCLSCQASSIRAPMNKRGSLKNVTFSADTV